MIHSDLESLAPIFQQKIYLFLDILKSDPEFAAAGYRPVVLETLRELPVQMAYFSRGRMKPQEVQAMYRAAGLYAIGVSDSFKTVTWTLESKHLTGQAADIAPSRDGARPDWLAPDLIWLRMAQIAEECGIKAGYRWKQKDSPHFEEA